MRHLAQICQPITFIFLVVSTSLLTIAPASAQFTGLVCITESISATGCPSGPPTIDPLIASNFTIGVFIQGSDPIGGFDIYVRSDPAYVVPVSVALGTLVASPTFTTICANDAAVNGTCSSNSANGPGVVEVSTVENSGNNDPGTGLAFTITYIVVRSNPSPPPSTPISYASASSCSPSSTGGDSCVIIDNNIGNVLPEVAQTANVDISAPSILIDGNGGFTQQNGVRGGDGTASDPYMINDWDVVGLTVRNTDAYFLIHNVYVHSFFGHAAFMNMINVSYGSVENSKIQVRMTIDSSSNLLLAKNYFSGISIASSGNILLSENSGSVITIASSRNLLLSKNSGSAITIDSSSSLTISGSASFGSLRISSSKNATLIENNLGSLGIYDSTMMVSSENILSTVGVHNSTLMVFMNNRFHSLDFFDSSEMTIENNTFSGYTAIRGPSAQQFDSYILTSDNTIGGRPLLVDRNCSGLTVNSIDVGELILFNCSGVNVTNLTSINLVEMISVDNGVVANVTCSMLIDNSKGLKVSKIAGDVELESATDIQVSNVAGDVQVGSASDIQISNVTGYVQIGSASDIQISHSAGVEVESSSDVSIFNNNGYGPYPRFTVSIYRSDNVSISDNAFCGGDCAGLTVFSSNHVTVSDNSFNGDEGFISGDSSFLKISGNLFQDVYRTLVLDSCSEVSIVGNQVIGFDSDYSSYGFVRLSGCDNVSISGNTLFEPSSPCGHYCYPYVGDFLKILQSSNVAILGNTISNATNAINIADSSNVTIYANNLLSSIQGIVLNNTSSFRIFHNNFIDDTLPPSDTYSSQNVWDNGYPGGGNYWSNSSHIDNCSGPQQDTCTGPDGIADTPYTFGSDEDHYPLTKPFDNPVIGTMSLSPSTILFRSPVRYVTATVVLPRGVNATSFVLSSIRLNGTLWPALRPQIRAETSNGTNRIVVTFNMAQVKSILPSPGVYDLQLTANIVTKTSFTPFIASSVVRVMAG